MSRHKALMNWSGGKDSALALYRCRHAGQYDVTGLLTTVSEEHQRVSMHGVRTGLLMAQAARLGLPLRQLHLPTDVLMETYNARMLEALGAYQAQGITYSVFGDIFLEDLRRYREGQLRQVNLTGVFPLWQRNPADLVREFADLGFRAVLVCVNEKHLGPEFLGRELDRNLLNDLPKSVDPCGENGEYHSFVYDGPIFSSPVPFTKGAIVRRTYTPSGASTPGASTPGASTPGASTPGASTPGASTPGETDNQPIANWDTGFWYQDLELAE